MTNGSRNGSTESATESQGAYMLTENEVRIVKFVTWQYTCMCTHVVDACTCTWTTTSIVHVHGMYCMHTLSTSLPLSSLQLSSVSLRVILWDAKKSKNMTFRGEVS